jgi:hypothetical protein
VSRTTEYLPSRIFSSGIFIAAGLVTLASAVHEQSVGAAAQGTGLLLFAWFMFLRPILLRGSPAPSWASAAAGSSSLRRRLLVAAACTYVVGVCLRHLVGL